VSYKIGFDGVVTTELGKVLQSIENRVNGSGIYAQASDVGASTVASVSTPPPCTAGQPCSDSEKGGHNIVVVVVIAIVAGAAAGYMAGKKGAKHVIDSEEGGHN